MSDDIIVTGRRTIGNAGNGAIAITHGTGSPGVRFVAPSRVSEDGSDAEPELQVSIAVHCTSAPDICQKVQTAAEQLVVAIINTITALEQTNPSLHIVIQGLDVTVGELYDTIMGTKYTVTDVSTFTNNGGGAADHLHMTDTIFYGTIGNPPVNSSGGVAPGTGYQQYTNGLIGLVLHEAAHMTVQGYDFYTRSVEVASRDSTVHGALYVSNDPGAYDYSQNVEAMMNEIARQAGSAIGQALPGFAPGTSAAPQTPPAIWSSHNGGSAYPF